MEIIRGDGSLLADIDLAPADERQEVIQNIAVILGTVMGEVPMLRGLGLPGDMMGRPLPAVQNMLVGYIYDQIEEYEPRALIGGVTFEATDVSFPMQGRLVPVVELEGIEEEEDGGE